MNTTAFPMRFYSLVLRRTPQGLRRQFPEPSLHDLDTGVGLFRVGEAPARHQKKLEAEADARGYRNAEHMLSDAENLPAAKARRQRREVSAPALADEDVPDLAAHLGLVGETDPNVDGGKSVWLRVVMAVEALMARGESQRQAIGRLLTFLLQRALCWRQVNRGTLQKQLQRSLARWQNVGKDVTCFLADDRHAKTVAFVPPAEDVKLLVVCAALQHGGELAPAWRQLHKQRRFSAVTYERYPRVFPDQGHKSDVPRCFRRAASARAKILHAQHFRPRQARIDGASRVRDWSGVHAADWFSCDDCTLPVWFWIEDEHGQPERDERGRVKLTRGQWLPMVDCKSKRILDYVLLSSEGYDAYSVRSLWNRVFARFGIPRRGLQLEQGLFKRSKLLRGSVPWADTVTGLGRLGIEIQYATTPSAKIIEQILGLFQRRLQGEFGHSSRDERRVKNERFEKHKRDVLAGRVHPSKHFYSYQQWSQRLEALVAEYNADVQEDSKVMGGTLSPEQAWTSLQDPACPELTRLSGALRALLAGHDFEVTVTRNGLSTTIAGRKFGPYYGAATSELKGRRVKCYLDLENPQFLTFEHPDTGSYLSVEQAPVCSAFDATPEQHRAANQAVAAHNGFAGKRRYFSTVPAEFIPGAARVACDLKAVELVTVMNAGRKQAAEQHEEACRGKRSRAKLAEQLNLPAGLELDADRYNELTPDARAAMNRVWAAVPNFDKAEAL